MTRRPISALARWLAVPRGVQGGGGASVLEPVPGYRGGSISARARRVRETGGPSHVPPARPRGSPSGGASAATSARFADGMVSGAARPVPSGPRRVLISQPGLDF
jgi:hypothetical protein